MKSIKCLFNFHSYNNWLVIGKSKEIKYFDILKRRCSSCGKIDIYEGFTQNCIIDGSKSPKVFD